MHRRQVTPVFGEVTALLAQFALCGSQRVFAGINFAEVGRGGTVTSDELASGELTISLTTWRCRPVIVETREKLSGFPCSRRISRAAPTKAILAMREKS